MKINLFNLIVVSASSPRIWRIQVSKEAVIILAMAFLLSFCITVAVVSSYPVEKLLPDKPVVPFAIVKSLSE